MIVKVLFYINKHRHNFLLVMIFVYFKKKGITCLLIESVLLSYRINAYSYSGNIVWIFLLQEINSNRLHELNL